MEENRKNNQKKKDNPENCRKKVSEKLGLVFMQFVNKKKTQRSNIQENQGLLQRQAFISSEKQQVEVFFGMQIFKKNFFIFLCLLELFEEKKKSLRDETNKKSQQKLS